MRILFLSESQGWSGGAAQLLLLGMGLREAGMTVKLASPADGEVARRAAAAGIEHIPFHPRQDYDLISAARLARLLERERIDVVHAHHPRAHAVGLASIYLSSRKPVFVVTRRVSFAMSRNIFSRLKYRNPRIDGFIAVADSIRLELIKGGVSPEKIAVIHSGVDTREYAPGPKNEAILSELAFPAGVPILGKVGNHGEWKGQDLFLEAAAELVGKGRKLGLVLAGRDTDSEDLRRKAEELGLGGCTRLLGFRTDVPRLLSVLDISVNAAKRGEGISGALRESLALGVPVVASDAGGNPELVQDKNTGRLFKAGASEDLARVLGELLDDPAEAKRQAERGRVIVQEYYSVERAVAKTLEYYKALAARRSPFQSELSERAV